jgi:hypothetical protein
VECCPQGIYRPRDAQATALYHLVEDNFDELERVWDDRIAVSGARLHFSGFQNSLTTVPTASGAPSSGTSSNSISIVATSGVVLPACGAADRKDKLMFCSGSSPGCILCRF